MAVGLGDALPHVEQRITARVYGDAALDGRADVDGRARGLPVVEVKEVDAPVQRGIDDLRQRPALLFLAHVHDAHDFFRPAHDGALARPAHAAPVVDLADGHAPDDLQLFRVVRDIAVGGAVAVVIAAESGHALHIRVFAGKPHVDLRRAGVGIHALAVLHGDALQAELRWRGNDIARAAQPGTDGGHGRSGGGLRGGRARRGGDDCVDRGGRGDGGRHACVRPAAEQRAQQQRQQQRQRRDGNGARRNRPRLRRRSRPRHNRPRRSRPHPRRRNRGGGGRGGRNASWAARRHSRPHRPHLRRHDRPLFLPRAGALFRSGAARGGRWAARSLLLFLPLPPPRR